MVSKKFELDYDFRIDNNYERFEYSITANFVNKFGKF